jgi:hypothetical protein
MWGSIFDFINCVKQNGREVKKSCDDKWAGDIVTVSVTPSSGFQFELGVSYDNLKLQGPMAEWNWGQRCMGKNDHITANSADLKQMKVWLHKEVEAYLQATSFKDNVLQETAFANVNELGQVSFEIPNDRLNKYNININLSDGRTITITPENVHQYAFLNPINEKTIFTLK